MANRLLRAAGYPNNSDEARNYIAQVAGHMGPGSDFDGVGACDLEAYAAAVHAYQIEIGALPPA